MSSSWYRLKGALLKLVRFDPDLHVLLHKLVLHELDVVELLLRLCHGQPAGIAQGLVPLEHVGVHPGFLYLPGKHKRDNKQ